MTFGRTEAEREAERILKALGLHTWRALVCPLQRRGPGGKPIGWFTRRADLWGVIDLACIHDKGFRFVQVCTQAGLAAHRRKMEEVPWPEVGGYTVEIFEAREGRDPLDGRRMRRGFRTHVFVVAERRWQHTGYLECLPKESKHEP